MEKNIQDLKVIFMGTPHLAREILAFLIESRFNINYVVTQPDRPAGRKQENIPSPVKKLAMENKIEVFQTEKIDKKTIDFFNSKKPDLIILVAFGMLLPQELLDIPKLGSINIHPSLLPKLRGPSPLQTALLEGEKETGVSIMLMTGKMDGGPILAQKKIEIGENDKYKDLEEKVITSSTKLLLETLKKWAKGKVTPEVQDDDKASFCKLISKKDGLIDWNKTSEQIFNQYRAFSEWPKVYSFWDDNNSKKKIIFNEIQHSNELFPDKKPGEVFQTDGKTMIATKSGMIIPKIVKLEGKKKMKIEDFVNGKSHFVGSKLE